MAQIEGLLLTENESDIKSEKRIETTETVPDCLAAVEDSDDKGISWFEEDDEEYFSHSVINSSPRSSELADYFISQGVKPSINDDENRRKQKLDGCNDTCRHKECLTPLPLFLWADSKMMWDIMMHKAEAAARNRSCRLFEHSPTVLPRMRAILLEWIMEICEVYHLRRATYYLAIDYIDRYLSINADVPKTQLQLLGISALYIAAKFEEIHTPRVSELAYVCDGACTAADILICERLLLNALTWDIDPMTPTTWLNLYMQIHFEDKKALGRNIVFEYEENKFFLYPRYSGYDFVRASHMIDLFSLDPCFLLFNYNVIAAAAMYYLYGKGCALKVSGLQWNEIKPCAEYMGVFYAVIRDATDPKLDSIPTHVPIGSRDRATYNFLRCRVPDVTFGEQHAMQTRNITLEFLERAYILRIQRMGFRITKVRTSSSKAKNKDPSSASAETTKIKEQEVMFEVERESTSNAAEDNCRVDISSMTDNDTLTKFLESKPQFTFDELLKGINECTLKKVLVKGSSETNDTTQVPD